ncbi:MAG: phosphate ABC transporter permease PstA [Chloroflexota bacterium]
MKNDFFALSSNAESQNKAYYRRRKRVNSIMTGTAVLATLLALLPLFWIVGYVFTKGVQAIDLAFLTQMPKPLGMEGGGVFHAIQGTLLLILLASIFAIPPGVLAAFYIANHPNTALGVAVRFGTDVLSGVPSIVIGLFGYTLVVKNQGHYSALAGGIALAIIMLPIIVRTTEEMLKLVPVQLREAGLALGGTEWQTSLGIILPAAGNGILTGFLLAVARASGETAPLLFTALGNENYNIIRIIRDGVSARQGVLSILHSLVNQPVDSLPLTLWKYAQQPYPERIEQAWAAAMMLMLFVLFLNILARSWIQSRASRSQYG